MPYDSNYFNETTVKNEDSIQKHFSLFRRENPKKKQKILDIGCAGGLFLKKCDDIGLKTYGLDISKYMIEQSKKITKANLFVHDLNKKLEIFDKNYFDFITMFDVIEHLHSPYYTLNMLHPLLKLGGKIIITTPNLSSIGKKIFRERWGGFLDKTHIYLFNPDSICFLLKKSGYKVLKVETPFHFIPIVFQKFANKSGRGGQIWVVASKGR
ncbi:MAG: methyltransferase domain-containing protein [Candidatus Aenigmarchaeota archaeon]|nr:methyltransferase domain-containing protein [Candidatus Aenigmarchaeota archaeon]